MMAVLTHRLLPAADLKLADTSQTEACHFHLLPQHGAVRHEVSVHRLWNHNAYIQNPDLPPGLSRCISQKLRFLFFKIEQLIAPISSCCREDLIR